MNAILVWWCVHVYVLGESGIKEACEVDWVGATDGGAAAGSSSAAATKMPNELSEIPSHDHAIK